MPARGVVKMLLPQRVRNVLRTILSGSLSKRDPFAPFTVPPYRIEAAKTRFGQINWPSDSMPRIIYGLTPTSGLRNVGDQAQVVAIERWFRKHYGSMEIIELDKDVILSNQTELVQKITPNDKIFLHSGGNMGDRGKWSETARRKMIELFPRNLIVSLPQTIFFSDSAIGRHERDISAQVYNAHTNLMVIGRDRVSGELAHSLFPHATITTIPDFVLSLKREDFNLNPDLADNNKIMACLRLDDEGILSREERHNIAQSLGQPATLYDTTLQADIPKADRELVLTRTLSLFSGHQAVVTDRFHGLIFAVICRKPTVVLKTIDHKLTSALEWFKDIPNVVFCDDPSNIKSALEKAKSTFMGNYPDFNDMYFDRLPQVIAEKDF